jgi:hypothetical protein
VLNTHAPLRKFRAPKIQIKWFREEIEQLKQVGDKYHTVAVETGDKVAWSQYKVLRNKITSMSRKNKKNIL